MATLTVLKFPTATGANESLKTLMSLQKQELINVQDAAIVTWPAGKKKPHTEQLHDMKGAGALSGGFWGLLLGILFFVPVLGLAVGAAFGALSGSLVDVGIDDDFIKSVREKVTEGTSALFLMTTDVVIGRVQEAMSGVDFELIASNLDAESEARLREVFEQD